MNEEQESTREGSRVGKVNACLWVYVCVREREGVREKIEMKERYTEESEREEQRKQDEAGERKQKEKQREQESSAWRRKAPAKGQMDAVVCDLEEKRQHTKREEDRLTGLGLVVLLSSLSLSLRLSLSSPHAIRMMSDMCYADFLLRRMDASLYFEGPLLEG